MAEFQEVMRQLNRLCSHYQNCDESGCPMFDECGNIGALCSEPKLSYRIEKNVMAWAAEHPEPVYPTWAEWLESMHVITVTPIDGCMTRKVLPAFYMFSQIPADIAEKLGLQPKEEREQ